MSDNEEDANYYSDSSSDDEYDENALKKFSDGKEAQLLATVHPECILPSMEEVNQKTIISRNKDGFDPNHTTAPFLNKYEKTRILGIRAAQLENNAPSFLEDEKLTGLINGIDIARLELEEQKIPFIVRRPLPDGTSEYWRVQDLEDVNF
jgi:DNA-directed RNA polymerase I, II, and III subunit RPABC2